MESAEIPAGWSRLSLPASEYLDANGPFYVTRDAAGVGIGLRIGARHANSIGTAHGGFIMTLADLVLTVGTNIQADLGRFLPTVSMSCDFLGPARIGSWIDGRIEVLRVTGSHAFSQAMLRTNAGDPVARASGILLLRGDRKPEYAPERYFSP